MDLVQRYIELCSLVLNLNISGQKDASWTPLFGLARKLHELFLCRICDNLVINPYTIISSNCEHTACKQCIVGEWTGICPSCVPEEAHLEEYNMLHNVLNGYIAVCKFIRASSFFRSTVLNDCTSDKLFFLAQVTEAANHGSRRELAVPDCNGTSNLPTPEIPVIQFSQASTSRGQTPNETSTESVRKSKKRRGTAPNKIPKKRIVDKTDVECESNQNCIEGDTDNICADQSEDSPTCSSLNHSRSNIVTSKGMKMSLNQESAAIPPESSHAKTFQKSNIKSLEEKKIVSEKGYLPGTMFTASELKKFTYCICYPNSENSVSTTCSALNCPCYLNDRACRRICYCQECVNPNNHKPASGQVSKKRVKKKKGGLGCSKTIIKVKKSSKNQQVDNLKDVKDCANIPKFISPTSNHNSETKPITKAHQDSVDPSEIISAADSETIVKAACSETNVNTSSSKTCVNTSSAKTCVSTSGAKTTVRTSSVSTPCSNPEPSKVLTVIRKVKSHLYKITEKPPLVNCNESPDNPELFDFSRPNINKYLYSDRGTGEKPGYITRTSVEKGTTREPNAELLRRVSELARMANAQAAANPKLMAYYINLNKTPLPGFTTDEVITIED